MTDKPIKNSHDAPAETPIETPASTIRTRRFRDRKKRGAIILQAEIQPDMVAQLVQLGWMHASESRDRSAVTAAIGACVLHSLSAGLKPPAPDRAYVPVDVRAVEAAACWLKPGTAITAETAGQALGTAVKCGALVNFGPREFSERLKAMAGIN